MRTLAIVLRVAGVLAVGAAVAVQLQRSVQNEAEGTGYVAYVVVNMFSFFTIQSNVLAVFVLMIGAVIALRWLEEPQWFGTVRAAVTTYMVVTGVVYNLLLRGIELPQGATIPWSNEVLHVVGPVILIADWLLVANVKRLPSRTIWWIVAYPIAWAAYTLLRGAFMTDPRTGSAWYPYPFLNPEISVNGYWSVTFYVLLIAGVVLLTGRGVTKTARVLTVSGGTPRHPTDG